MTSPLGRLRFGIFGGSFDPIHEGHLRAAEGACERLGIDRVLLIPANLQPLKDGYADANHRLEMVGLATRDRQVLVESGIELRRGGTSYTIDTVRKLSHDLGHLVDLFLLMGTDAVRDMPRWRNVSEIFSYVTPVVLERVGDDPMDWDDLAGRLPTGLADKFRDSMISLTQSIEVSSTEIRRQLAAGESISGLVPAAVEGYIYHNGLYGTARGQEETGGDFR